MGILIIYPHGLGDCLMLTPALRQYYITYGNKLSVAILERFESSKIFANNPYIDRCFPILKDAWNDFSSPQVGFIEVQRQGELIAKENNLIPIFLNQPPPTHKIFKNAELLGLQLNSTQIDVFISENDKKVAEELIQKFVENNEYGFIQTHTGVPSKDLPNSFGEKWLRKHNGLNHFIEIDKNFKYNEYNINIQFEILRRASAVCVPDSVFYHACSGLNKNINFAFFGRGSEVYSRVGNLNKNITENVYYQIPII
jgi:hypothetical protein